MNMNASAGKGGTKNGGSKSFLDWCEKLTLTATRQGEPELFAAIASAFYRGGTIEITRPGKEPLRVEYGPTEAVKATDKPAPTSPQPTEAKP